MKDRGLHRGERPPSGSHVGSGGRWEGRCWGSGTKERASGGPRQATGCPGLEGRRGRAWPGLRRVPTWKQARSCVCLWASARARSGFWERSLGQYCGHPPLSPASDAALFWPVFSFLLSPLCGVCAAACGLRPAGAASPLQGSGPGAWAPERRRTGFAAPRHVPSSWTSDQTCVPCAAGRVLAPGVPGKSLGFVLSSVTLFCGPHLIFLVAFLKVIP